MHIGLRQFTLYLFVPFYLWGFLGGHKQYVLSLSTDHAFIALAFLGATTVWLGGVPRRAITLIVLALSLILAQSISLIGNLEASSFYTLLSGAVYLYIFTSYACFFSKDVDKLITLTILSATVSYIVIISSWLALGFSSWGRITIPIYVWSTGEFQYYPYGYEGSSDANVLAYFVYSGLFVGWFLWRHPNNYLKLLFSAFGVLAGVLTVSRSGALGFLIVVALLSAGNCLRLLTTKKVSRKSVIKLSLSASLFLVSAVILGASDNPLRDQLEERLTTGSEVSNADRLSRLRLASDLIISSDINTLFIGRGAGYSRLNNDPHNVYLSSVIDSGFLGATAFVGMPLLIALVLLSSKKQHIRIRSFVLCLTAFFLVVSVFYWQVRFYYYVSFWLSVLYLVNRNASTDPPRHPDRCTSCFDLARSPLLTL